MPTTLTLTDSNRHDIKIKKRVTFEMSFYMSTDDIVNDIQGFTGHMQIREGNTNGDLLLDLTTDNGGILINEDNIVTIKITAAQTSQLKECKALYDILLINGDDVINPLEGVVDIVSGVTQHEW